ncbi:MAG: receptor-binding domain of short tail fiber protein [Circular genetic element sp.]|nr:MAG: receptor-binding domain of short tail fiber protein [Circular genetic element sp.]
MSICSVTQRVNSTLRQIKKLPTLLTVTASWLVNGLVPKIIMGSPFLQFEKLDNLANTGGYQQTTALTQLSSVFLLSACTYLRERWLWQSPNDPIDNNTYNQILDMIDETEAQLMENVLVGSIISSVALITNPNYLPMIGQLIPVADYPELANVVPVSWIVGADIQIPNMTAKGLFGAVDIPTIGIEVGENFTTLTEAQMPVHTHIQDTHSHSQTIPVVTPTGAGPIVAGASVVVPTPSTTGFTTATNQNAGNGDAHLNVPEVLLTVWYIVAR